ncbi:hypothetical protein K443DRAFT_10947 [Laccaria amethystina LaAM-08-1]|uniref:Uncharacterized protein n=1 Tax=Laccaria amethystina LaAM-08-1 TaxID=1095629 RepID=A0A0C9WK87_9AGAR|nr:hypothetical protein K443DRAFT_10947 [Laccaria amethystina LaAM-08-1]
MARQHHMTDMIPQRHNNATTTTITHDGAMTTQRDTTSTMQLVVNSMNNVL